MMVRAPEKPSSGSITVDQAIELLRGPRAKLKSSGLEKDGGLEVIRFDITFPLTTTDVRAVDLRFSAVLSVDTVPTSLTKLQALEALTEYAREESKSQQAM